MVYGLLTASHRMGLLGVYYQILNTLSMNLFVAMGIIGSSRDPCECNLKLASVLVQISSCNILVAFSV